MQIDIIGLPIPAGEELAGIIKRVLDKVGLSVGAWSIDDCRNIPSGVVFLKKLCIICSYAESRRLLPLLPKLGLSCVEIKIYDCPNATSSIGSK